jgi:hypothetical protein
MAETKIPTTSEVQAIHALMERWSDVVDNEFRYRFHRDAQDRQDDARAMLQEYLLRRGPNFLDRYLPDRDRNLPAMRLIALYEAAVSEPRGAFRMWVRPMVRWVFRDWCRSRKIQGELLEVHVVPDGKATDRHEARGTAFERLAAEDDERAPENTMEREHAQDVVALLMESASPDLCDDMAIFLAAQEAGDVAFRAHGTSRAAILKRLERLRPAALDALRQVGPWGA